MNLNGTITGTLYFNQSKMHWGNGNRIVPLLHADRTAVETNLEFNERINAAEIAKNV